MANGFLVVNEKDFENMDTNQREWLFFNTLQSLTENVKGLQRAHIRWSLVGGAIGGAFVMGCLTGVPNVAIKLIGG